MATEKRLIDANALLAKFKEHRDLYAPSWESFKASSINVKSRVDEIDTCMADVINAPTVDAVEVADMREFAEDVAYQFGYYCQKGGRLHITHGGLSTLEHTFDILGWENPHPVPECECEIEGCHEYATCGTPTADGYKRTCGKHFHNHCAKMDGGSDETD